VKTTKAASLERRLGTEQRAGSESGTHHGERRGSEQAKKRGPRKRELHAPVKEQQIEKKVKGRFPPIERRKKKEDKREALSLLFVAGAGRQLTDAIIRPPVPFLFRAKMGAWVYLQFSGGLETLFDNVKSHKVEIPSKRPDRVSLEPVLITF